MGSDRVGGAASGCVKGRRSMLKVLTLVDDLGDDGVLCRALDAHALPAVAQGFAVVVGAVPVVLPSTVVPPGEVVVAVAVAQIDLQRREVRVKVEGAPERLPREGMAAPTSSPPEAYHTIYKHYLVLTRPHTSPPRVSRLLTP